MQRRHLLGQALFGAFQFREVACQNEITFDGTAGGSVRHIEPLNEEWLLGLMVGHPALPMHDLAGQCLCAQRLQFCVWPRADDILHGTAEDFLHGPPDEPGIILVHVPMPPIAVEQRNPRGHAVQQHS